MIHVTQALNPNKDSISIFAEPQRRFSLAVSIQPDIARFYTVILSHLKDDKYIT